MLPTVKWRGGTQEEYETQYYGFGAQSLQIAVHSMFEANINSSIATMRDALLKSLNDSEKDEKAVKIETFSSDLTRLYCEKSSDVLEAIDRNIEKMIQIPEDTLLPGDEVHADEIEDDEFRKLKNEVEELELRLKRTTAVETLMESELKDILSFEPVCALAADAMHTMDSISNSLKDRRHDIEDLIVGTELICAKTLPKNNFLL